MLSIKPRLQRGFTIVEVMIVLAVAGVMMSIVFLAIPQLQRNSRDAQRQSVAESIRTEIETYASNNNGRYPLNYDSSKVGSCGSGAVGSFADFYCNYIKNGTTVYKDDGDPTTKISIFQNGSTASFAYQPRECSAGSTSVGTACDSSKLPAVGKAQIFIHAKCSGGTPVSADGLSESESSPTLITTRSYALVMGLERSGAYFCVDNS